MIQRIQSIFFLLAATFIALLFLEPFSFFNSDPNPESPYFNDGAFEVSDNNIMIALYVIAIGSILITLFLYKNRRYQRIAAYFSIIAILIASSYTVFIFSEQGIPFDQIRFGLGTAIPLMSMISLALGSNYVKKDEQLVKSADRLR